MRIGIATDHGGFGVKEELVARIRAAGHEVVDFGAHSLNPDDDYPDYVVPLGQAVRGRQGGSLRGDLRQRRRRVGLREQSTNGVRACLIHDHFSAKQGVEDDHTNILCMGGRTVGPEVAWDLVQTYLAAEYSSASRHLRRLGKVAALESERRTP